MTRAFVVVLACAACSSEDATSTPPEQGWEAIRNPFLAFEDVAIKDSFCVRRADTWKLGIARSRDLVTWEAPREQ